MKSLRDSLWSTFISGVLIVVPTYLALIVLLRGMRTVADLVRPLTTLLPDWLPNENLVALLLVFLLCLAVGSAVRTRAGHAAADRLKTMFLQTFQTLSRWGSGSGRLLHTMQPADAVHK